MDRKPIAAGKSSYNLIDTDKFFAELSFVKGKVLLDLACGSGAYSLAWAQRSDGPSQIHAVDLWKEGIEALQTEAAGKGIRIIQAVVADVGKYIPVEDGSIDVCLAATVLHDLVEDGTEKAALREIQRVLRPGGTLAVVEFKKIPGPPGPPVHIRLAPGELSDLLAPYGFRPVNTTEIGPYNYLSLFTATTS